MRLKLTTSDLQGKDCGQQQNESRLGKQSKKTLDAKIIFELCRVVTGHEMDNDRIDPTIDRGMCYAIDDTECITP